MWICTYTVTSGIKFQSSSELKNVDGKEWTRGSDFNARARRVLITSFTTYSKMCLCMSLMQKLINKNSVFAGQIYFTSFLHNHY